jgi:site-specific recombinase XerD
METTKGKIGGSRDILFSLKNALKARGLSLRTQKTYLYYNRRFLEFARKNPSYIKNEDIERYLVFLFDQKVSNGTLNLVINALKFYYVQVWRRKFFFNFKRPKKESRLPVVLSENEVKKIIKVTKDIKHKLILSVMYSAGLRVSEVVGLKVKNIDFEEGIIRVEQGKGDKDRMTIISKKLLKYLKIYLKNKHKNSYVFSSRKNENRLTTRTIQKIFQKACEKAQINKEASCHSLRHSFATHLLEGGVSIRYIQKLLGHKKLETTQIYTKVSSKKLKEIINPFDKLSK